MRRWLKFATLICTLSLLGSAVGLSAESTSESRQAVALWLSQQIQRPVAAAQLLIVPTVTHLDGCSVAHARSSVIGTTALSLHCPSQGLPQLALLNFSVATPDQSTAFSPLASHRVFLKVTPTPPTLVHAGAALNADWRTDTIHVQLPVVALDSGTTGAEIRVRITRTNRILQARIVGAHTVIIVTPFTDSEHSL